MISVVIPMYNAEDTIIEALDSVLNQTYEDAFEVLIVNDGSSDDSEMLVKKYIETNKSNKIIKLINKENGGVSSARNRGIIEASSEWIALLDSDDIWLNEKLEKQILEINNNQDIEFIGTNRNGEVYPYFGKKNKPLYTLTAKETILKWHPQTSTVLIKKNLLERVGLYNELKTHAEDIELWIRLLEKTKLYVLNKDLVYTGDGKLSFGVAGLSADLLKMHKGEIYVINEAKKRKQINYLEYLFFYNWLKMKYFRRIVIIKLIK